MEEQVTFLGREYFFFLSLVLFARGMDFLSTWIATPNLVLEANPLARRLGWRWALPINFILCLLFALWPLAAIIIATTSVLVAARNFQVAWLMRTAGEEPYRMWMLQRLAETPPTLFVFCLISQSFLVAVVGGVVMAFSLDRLVPFGIGVGIVAYALAVTLFSLLAVWRQLRTGRT